MLTPKQVRLLLNVTNTTLLSWVKKGKIGCMVLPGNQRRYYRKDIDKILGKRCNRRLICYCRVDTRRLSEKLEEDVAFMKEVFPTALIIKDYGSNRKYNRPGLKKIISYLMYRDRIHLVVKYKTSLCRAGFELIELMVKENGGKITVLN